MFYGYRLEKKCLANSFLFGLLESENRFVHGQKVGSSR
jgi:hypothetical protein